MKQAPPRKVLRKVLLLSNELYIGIPKHLADALGITRGQLLIVRASGRRGFQAHRLTETTLAYGPRSVRSMHRDSSAAASAAGDD